MKGYINDPWWIQAVERNIMCYSSVTSAGNASLTYCFTLINVENRLKVFLPFLYEPFCLYLFSWLTPPIITVWHTGPTVNNRDRVHALLTGGLCNSVAQMPRQPIIRHETGPGEANTSFFFTCKFYNVIINTWHGAWLNYPPCLIKGAAYCSSQPFVALLFLHLPLCNSVSSPSLFFLFPFPLHSYFSQHSSLLSSSFLTFSLLPSHPLPSLLIFLPPFSLSSLPPFYHSAVSQSYIITFFVNWL